jgi:hypothetical protein
MYLIIYVFIILIHVCFIIKAPFEFLANEYEKGKVFPIHAMKAYKEVEV